MNHVIRACELNTSIDTGISSYFMQTATDAQHINTSESWMTIKIFKKNNFHFPFQNEVTQKEILEQLPTKIETVKMMSLGKILSEKATRSLGDFEIQYMYHPKVVAALKQ